MTNLSTEDADLFYQVQMSFLAYVCQQLQVVPGVSMGADIRHLPLEQVGRIRDQFLEHPNLLERFVAENPEHLAPDRLAIVAAWKYRVEGNFLIVRFLKAYTVFINTQEPAHLYGVLGLYDPLEELLGAPPLPLYVRAVLLPFRGRIIYDGLLSTHSIRFGSGLRSGINEQFRMLKAQEGITEQLVDAEGQPRIVTSLARQKPRKPAPDWRPLIDEIVAKTDKMRQADSPVQGAALELLRASARLAQVTFSDPQADLGNALRQVRTAVTKLQR